MLALPSQELQDYCDKGENNLGVYSTSVAGDQSPAPQPVTRARTPSQQEQSMEPEIEQELKDRISPSYISIISKLENCANCDTNQDARLYGFSITCRGPK